MQEFSEYIMLKDQNYLKCRPTQLQEYNCETLPEQSEFYSGPGAYLTKNILPIQ